ncbi:hypothetical protein [uncultured Ruegeria sp.]|uniref:hypothetical protein n=1 Tax=uncultured Ruegeria sp. TaxID=259304 RepID=UPI002636EAF1|nr:hypothetical protein [uncultured Ruegeria sp.]
MRRLLKNYRTRRPSIPRRTRRGFSVVEAALVLLIVVVVLQSAISLGRSHLRNHQGLNEARLLTQVVDAGATLALRDLDYRINSEIGVGKAQVLTLGDLEAQGLWTAGSDRLTALSRTVTLILHARGSEELVLLARATALPGETNPAYIPAGGEGVGLVGFVSPDDTTRLRGPGIDYDLTGVQALTGGPSQWDAVAIRVVRMDRNVLPFLHRTTQPGFPELNRMETDLNMNGSSLVGAGVLDADQVMVTTGLQAGTVAGILTVDGDITAAGALDVGGTLGANAATIAGAATAASLTVTNQAAIETLDTGTLTTASSVSVNQDLVVEGTTTLDVLAVNDLSAKGIEAGRITAGTLAADTVFGTTANLETGQLERLNTGGCVGC